VEGSQRVEQKAALRELQDIDKENVHAALEAKTGKIHAKMSKTWKVDDPNEWRPWSKMGVDERKVSYKRLQVLYEC
jgi:hypothetical protein